MQDNQQFEQLMLQYKQLKNGAEDIYRMINNENFDEAISLMKSREAVFLNCKCIRKYLDLNKSQKEEADRLLQEISELEQRNIELLSANIEEVKAELKKVQQSEKIQNAYEFDDDSKGSIVNIKEEL